MQNAPCFGNVSLFADGSSPEAARSSQEKVGTVDVDSDGLSFGAAQMYGEARADVADSRASEAEGLRETFLIVSHVPLLRLGDRES